jgi:hypothetical protein
VKLVDSSNTTSQAAVAEGFARDFGEPFQDPVCCASVTAMDTVLQTVTFAWKDLSVTQGHTVGLIVL